MKHIFLENLKLVNETFEGYTFDVKKKEISPVLGTVPSLPIERELRYDHI